VKPFARVFATMFDNGTADPEALRRRQIHQEWDRQRANALTQSELSEIDAIFARNL